MSLRSLAVFLFIQLALGSTAAWTAQGETKSTPAIELSDTAEGDGNPGSAEDGAKQRQAKGFGAVEVIEAVEVVDPVEVVEPVKAVETAAAAAGTDKPESAAADGIEGSAAVGESAQAVPSKTVPWWREAASLLRLAPDAHPGETAEPAPGRPALTSDYLVGPGDVLGISVWRDENLTRSVVVLPDGKIHFPLVGDIVAGGKTVAQLKQEMEKKLARYVTDAGLTVEVKQSNSMIIYVIGRVNAPGRQTMVASTNVLQALAMVGGLNPFARRSEIKVFRQQGGKTSVFSFDYDDVSEGRHLETNIDLQRGDVVIVP